MHSFQHTRDEFTEDEPIKTTKYTLNYRVSDMLGER